LIESENDAAKIVPTIERAYEKHAPVVMMIGREPAK
jgi:hypothetical protein